MQFLICPSKALRVARCLWIAIKINLTLWSARTLKPLTADRNNFDHLITMRCSAGKPWMLAFMWMPLDTYHPSKHCTDPHHNNTSWWQWPPSRTMFPDTLHTLLRSRSRTTIKCPWCRPGLQIPQIPIWSSICKTCWAGLIHGGPTPQTYRSQMIHYKTPDATGHLQRP